MAFSRKKTCDICKKDVVKLKRHIESVHPNITVGRMNQILQTKKLKKDKESYITCPFVFPDNEQCVKLVLKSGYVISIFIS